MNKKKVDSIVQCLLDADRGERWTKTQIQNRYQTQYSKDQIERIYHRYNYLLRKQENTAGQESRQNEKR